MKEITNRWIYKGGILQEPPKNAFGFVYEITTKDGKKYIGQKRFFSRVNRKLSKKRQEELWSGKGRKPTKELIVRESNWKTYRSSNKDLKDLGERDFEEFKILHIVSSLNMLNIMETYYIIIRGALFKEEYLNGWAKFTLNKSIGESLDDFDLEDSQ